MARGLEIQKTRYVDAEQIVASDSESYRLDLGVCGHASRGLP